MKEITIFNTLSSKNLPELKQYLAAGTLKLREVSIRYNPDKGLPDEKEIDSWPVKLIFLDEKGKFVIIRIWSLTAGYGGSGPTDLEEMLNYLKVKHNPRDIFSRDKLDSDGYITLHYEML